MPQMIHPAGKPTASKAMTIPSAILLTNGYGREARAAARCWTFGADGTLLSLGPSDSGMEDRSIQTRSPLRAILDAARQASCANSMETQIDLHRQTVDLAAPRSLVEIEQNKNYVNPSRTSRTVCSMIFIAPPDSTAAWASSAN